MAIARTYETVKTGARNPLTLHTYVDDTATGGEVVLSCHPTDVSKAGIIETLDREWIAISVKNRGGSALNWTKPPQIRGTNECDVDNPSYGHGYVLPPDATKGSFGATINAGDEQFIWVDAALTGFGIIVQVELQAADSDIALYEFVEKIRR